MQKPTWAKVVGIIGIIIACFGLLGAWQTTNIPKMIKFQKEMMPQIEKRMAEKHQGSSEETMKMMEKMWNVPEWFNGWCVIAGVITFMVSGFYLYASIGLMQIKKIAISLFYMAGGASIIFSVIKGFMAISAMSFMGISLVFGDVFGIIVNIILLIVVASGNKEAFQHN